MPTVSRGAIDVAAKLQRIGRGPEGTDRKSHNYWGVHRRLGKTGYLQGKIQKNPFEKTQRENLTPGGS